MLRILQRCSVSNGAQRIPIVQRKQHCVRNVTSNSSAAPPGKSGLSLGRVRRRPARSVPKKQEQEQDEESEEEVVEDAEGPFVNESDDTIDSTPTTQMSQLSNKKSLDELIEVGRILAVHGVRGEVKVEVRTDSPAKRFAPRQKLWFRPEPMRGLLATQQTATAPSPQDNMYQMSVESSRSMVSRGEEVWLVKFKEVEGREQAEKVLRHTLLIPLNQREKLKKGEVYLADLVGCSTFHKASGKYIGKVIEVYPTGMHDTLQIQLLPIESDIQNSKIRTCMVPFVKELVPHVDVDAQRIEVDPPEGLLDVVTVSKMKKPLSAEGKAAKLKELEELRKQLGDLCP